VFSTVPLTDVPAPSTSIVTKLGLVLSTRRAGKSPSSVSNRIVTLFEPSEVQAVLPLEKCTVTLSMDFRDSRAFFN
jgi:photosystem II stability/assembly factor-like uncharacterized protein